MAISTSQSIRFLLLTRLYVVKFLDTNLKNDINRAIEEFSKFENDISSLKNLSKNTQIKNTLDEVSTLSLEYNNGLNELVGIIEKEMI